MFLILKAMRVSWYQGGAMPESPTRMINLKAIDHGAMFGPRFVQHGVRVVDVHINAVPTRQAGQTDLIVLAVFR